MKKDLDKSLQPVTLNLTEQNLINKIYTDPATVIAIIETGKKIYDMFNRKKKKPSEELIYLKKIYTEIRDMQNDLKLIISLLQDLKIYFDQRQVEFIANTLSTEINTADLFLIGWLENRTGNLEERFATMHKAKELLGIYGFAHIHVYILAFKKELDLCYWLKKGPAFTNILLTDSRKYFVDASNPLHPLETPAKRLNATIALMQELENKFTEAKFTEQIRTIIPARGNDNRAGYQITLYTLEIKGNLPDGFVFSISPTIIEIRPPYHHEHNEPPQNGGGAGGHFLELEQSVYHIQNQTPSLDNITKSYNNARQLYLLYLKSKMELAETYNTIISMIKIIDELS